MQKLFIILTTTGIENSKQNILYVFKETPIETSNFIPCISKFIMNFKKQWN